jgi:hypothetical protein
LAVAAGALGAAQPKGAAQQPTDAAKNKIKAAPQQVAGALKQPQHASQHNEPCRHGDDNRSSDLCAQWKAADAAQSAAQAAWWIGWIGAAIGAFTLAAAWAAARWARKAAVHTEESAIEARRAADAAHDANRPWLELMLNGHEDFSQDLSDWGAAFEVHVATANRGNSPATNVFLVATLTANRLGTDNPIDVWKAIREAEDLLDEVKGQDYGFTAFPGEHPAQPVMSIMEAEPLRELRDYPGNEITFLLAVGARYTFGGDREGRTIVGYYLNFSGVKPFDQETTPKWRIELVSSHTGYAI